MSLQEQTPDFSTSAAGPMVQVLTVGHQCIAAYILVSYGTSATPMTSRFAPCGWRHTSGGTPVVLRDDNGVAIAELRRVSGLTWEQLAKLFGVTRRSMHFWASGKQLTPANEERLHRTLAAVRKIDRGDSNATRLALFQASIDGQMPFDMLVDGRYEEAIDRGGMGPARPRPIVKPRLSQAAQEARVPSPPDRLIKSVLDPAHRERGRLLSAKPIKGKGARGK